MSQVQLQRLLHRFCLKPPLTYTRPRPRPQPSTPKYQSQSQARSFSVTFTRHFNYRSTFCQQSKTNKTLLTKPKHSSHTVELLKHPPTPPSALSNSHLASSPASLPIEADSTNPLAPQNGPQAARLRSSFEDPLLGLSPPFDSSSELVSDLTSPPDPPSAPPPPSPLPSEEPASPKPQRPSTSQSKRVAQVELPKILPTHAFNTHQFVRKLETSAFDLPVARTVMRVVQKSLEASEHRWLLSGPSGGVVSRAYAEGQAYLYDAALGELRTEVKVKTRNDGIVLKSASNRLQREIDALKQKMKEDVDGLKNEIQLEMNGRKEEASDDQKKLELAIQELNSKFTILVGDVRTEIETRKWVTTRRCIVAIASLALCVVIFTALESNQMGASSSSTSSAQTQLQREVLKTVEELGITPARDESDSVYSGTLLGQGKRVGEEDSHDGHSSI
ncbi:hypothetical protein CROQUDRAFT_87558 [Cronartium quercuum f. sp. fusiforme G11]|uniref:Uncharacterized protein n=1 Tax=Cronartium quercuum f. sp. fusiforme G11 TaxID=708437 RepID=A0A9P6TFT6_9BASI|nr:hypothetical protein CROQUDRAFT_87558 [Cronartium quercuum f. sp. fusiforme G11]